MRRKDLDTVASETDIRAGSKHMSFEEARSLYQSSVWVFVSRRIRPAEDAEDIVAQVFLEAYKHWRRCKGDPKCWLLGIARRKLCDALRKRRETWALRETDLGTDALDGFVESAELQLVGSILKALRPDERDAFLMQVVDGYEIAEIAEILHRSPAATNSLLQRARARIKKALEAQGGIA